jgi:DNA-binding NarL/FixJ family response regulator
MRVLVVEDSALILERLVASISSLPEVSEVLTARTLREAEKRLAKDTMDVVTLDLRLPDGSGISLLERLQTIGRTGNVIVITNFPYPEYRKRCEQLGVHRFFDKSEDFDKLGETIREIARDV